MLRIALRPPRLWQPASLAASLGLGSVGACGLVYLELLRRMPEQLTAVAIPLGLAAVVSLALALGALAIGVIRRPRTGEWIVLSSDTVELPVPGGFGGSRRIAYADIRDAVRWQHLGLDRVMVIAPGAPLGGYAYARSRFARPDDAERLIGELRRRLAALPDGAERLRNFDLRTAAAHLYVSRPPWFTLSLMAVLLAAFLLELRVGVGGDPSLLIALGAKVSPLIAQGELYRVVTASFLHSDAVHLLGNVVLLLMIGSLLEPLLGALRLGVIAGSGALAGILASTWLNASAVSTGASAAVYALLGAWPVVVVRFRREMPGNFQFPWWCWALVAILLALEVAIPYVDHTAHAGGFLAGVLAALVWARGAPLARLARHRSHALIVVASALAVVFVAGIAAGLRNARRLADPPAADAMFAHWLTLPDLHPAIRNAFSRYIATSSAATPEVLRAARAAEGEVLAKVPDDPAGLDTLATLHFRLREFEPAVELERRALRQKPDSFKASQLARFEQALLRGAPSAREDSGALQLVPGPKPRLSFEPPAGLAGVGALDVYALVESPGGALQGLAWLTLHCGSGGPGTCAVAVGSSDFPSDATLVIAHVVSAPDGAGAPSWRFWPLDPKVAALPGPLPLPSLSLAPAGRPDP